MPAGNLTDEDLKYVLTLLGTSAQDAAIKAKIEADLPAPPPPLVAGVEIEGGAGGVKATALPAGASGADWAWCLDVKGTGPLYPPGDKDIQVGAVVKPPDATHVYADAIARNTQGSTVGLGGWWSTRHEGKRIHVEGSTPPPPPPPPPPVEEPTPPPVTGFKRGVHVGDEHGWPLTPMVADCKRFPNPVVRLEKPSDTASFSSAGVSVIFLESAYNKGNVKAINVATAVVNAQTTLRNHADIWCYEYGNEPGGDWFFGTGALSKENAAAYCKLLRAIRTQAMSGSKVLLLASFDGGHAGNNQWGHWMLESDPGITSIVDAFSVHPYDGSGASASSTLVRWSSVEDAHKATGKPVIVSEYGRPLLESTGDSPKSTEAQQAAADGAMVKKCRESGFVLAVTIYGYRGDSSPCYAVFKGDDSPRPAVQAIINA